MQDGGPNLQCLVLERIDRSLGMYRYYVLAVEPDLFGGAALVRAWGRIGRRARQSLSLYADAGSAAEELQVWLERKRRRGYAAPRRGG